MKHGKLIGLMLILVGFFFGGQFDKWLSQNLGLTFLSTTLYSQSLNSFLSWSTITFIVRYTFIGVDIMGTLIGLHMLVVIGILLLMLT